ncbi:unnamed protein product, partial [Mesorhabditis belari]|uniref:Uncharacterized protein n=1 Tax=Mesorhabditis belari TaxID=2138241 RepID=A0AAF3FQQ8_9BILA
MRQMQHRQMQHFPNKLSLINHICPFPWQSHEQNILATFAQCREFEHEGVKCTPHDPIECTGRNPVCVFSKMTDDYRCCSDVPQDLSSPPGVPEQVKPICPYGATSYDIPSVLLCDPTEEKSCPDEYTCEQAVNSQMLSTYNMHLCCKTTALDSFENVFYETKRAGHTEENFITERPISGILSSRLVALQ